MDSDPKMASKPAQVKEKIVMGKMNKFYEENCLLQMEFVRSDMFQGTVEHYIADAGKKLGGSVKFVNAVRFQTGEGHRGKRGGRRRRGGAPIEELGKSLFCPFYSA